MNKLMGIAFLGVLSGIASACSDTSDGSTAVLDNFDKVDTLTGRPVTFDTIPGVVGNINIAGDMYLFFLYDSDNLLMSTDTDFNITGYKIRKGEGPGEMSWLTTYGEELPAGNIFAYEPYARKYYNIAPDSVGTATLAADLAEPLKEYAPSKAIRLADGRFVVNKGNGRYGLVCYNPAGKEINEWPIGFEFDAENPNQTITSGHIIGYNAAKGIVAEMYCEYPGIVLHDTDGSIKKILTIGELPAEDMIKDDARSHFCCAKFTESHMYLLYGDDSEDEFSRVMVVDYDYNPVADLHIAPAQSMDIDAGNRRIIAVNPNSDTENLMVYDLPDYIAEP